MKTRLLTTILAGFISLPIVCHADGFYIGGFGGIAYTPNIKSPVGTGHFDDPGWQTGAHLGYRGGPIRYEGELAYFNSKFGRGAIGKNETYAGLLNIIYNFQPLIPALAIQPHLGIGMGYAHVRTKINNALGTVKVNDNEFAYQGIAGLNYFIKDTLQIFANYRYIGTTKVTALDSGYENHTINFGVNLYFDEPAEDL